MFHIVKQREGSWGPKRNLDHEFALLLNYVNAVNHGEFESAVKAVLQQAEKGGADGGARCSAFALQRCRRGGKTFMLHNLASQLSQQSDQETLVIFSP